jgi:hypothetical protein
MQLRRSMIWAIFLLASLSFHTVHAVEEIVELRLQKVKALEGVVMYSNGDAIAGARVAELTFDWKTELRSTSTDSAGHFRLPPVKGRKVYYLQITLPGASGVNPLRVSLTINRFWGKGAPLRLHLQLA